MKRRAARTKRVSRSDINRRARRAAAAFGRLVRVMDTLRSADGCPWDREQTHDSLRPHLLEETYEAVEAIDRGDLEHLPVELGDVLFQCVFHAQIGAEARRFEIGDAVEAITAKLIRRHPHVFTPAGKPLSRASRKTSRVSTPEAVKEQWEQIKAQEQERAGTTKRVLAGIPRSMPALQRAHEIGRRVAAVGFDWTSASDVVAKIEEELDELRRALSESHARTAEELGDFLFALANFARKLGVEPESALRAANDKFTRRFDDLESSFQRDRKSVHGATLAEMEERWQAIKAKGRRHKAKT